MLNRNIHYLIITLGFGVPFVNYHTSEYDLHTIYIIIEYHS